MKEDKTQKDIQAQVANKANTEEEVAEVVKVEKVEEVVSESQLERPTSLSRCFTYLKTIPFSQWKKGLLLMVLIGISFNVGQYFESRTRNTVYILDEKKFLTLASVGIATGDKASGVEISDSDKAKVVTAVNELNRILQEEYVKHPVLIKKQGSYQIYSAVNKIDLTEPVIKKVIGEQRWKEIGKTLAK